MRSLIRYLASYLIDSFRERVVPDDFAKQQVRRVWALDEEAAVVARRFFPNTEVAVGGRRVGRYHALVIPMRGGNVGVRLGALLGRAWHRLLVPSPDYVYRLGMRGGPLGLAWAIADRLLLAPLALLWLGAVTIVLYGSGLAHVGREEIGGCR